MSPANPSVPNGTTQQLTATGIYSDDNTSDISADVNWISSNESVAIVNSNGLISVMPEGSTIITALMDDINPTT
ncbi:Ig-like domain-containing protein [Spirochaetota bacterium]